MKVYLIPHHIHSITKLSVTILPSLTMQRVPKICYIYCNGQHMAITQLPCMTAYMYIDGSHEIFNWLLTSMTLTLNLSNQLAIWKQKRLHTLLWSLALPIVFDVRPITFVQKLFEFSIIQLLLHLWLLASFALKIVRLWIKPKQTLPKNLFQLLQRDNKTACHWQIAHIRVTT